MSRLLSSFEPELRCRIAYISLVPYSPTCLLMPVRRFGLGAGQMIACSSNFMPSARPSSPVIFDLVERLRPNFGLQHFVSLSGPSSNVWMFAFSGNIGTTESSSSSTERSRC